MSRTEGESTKLSVVWGLPSRLIGQIGSVPDHVQLDVISTAWALLRRVRGQPCDLLMIHWELADSTGPAVAARVRILHSELPIVLTTDPSEEPELGMDLAALRVLGPMRMPVYWPHLLERVSEVVARREDARWIVEGEPASTKRRRVLQ